MDLDNVALGDVDDGSTQAAQPPSLLDSLSPEEVSQVQSELATELFGFTPQTFTSRIVDLANAVVNDVVDKIEVEVKREFSGKQMADGKSVKEDDLAKGVNRLETLLYAAVDMRFDQAETWIVRNTFKFPIELVPYILLPHHPSTGYAPYLKKGQDEAMVKVLEKEMEVLKTKRQEVRVLGVVEERMQRKVAALREMKRKLGELVPGGGARDNFSSATASVSESLPAYLSTTRTLLAPSQSTSSSTATEATASASTESGQQPWKQSREAYLAWVLEKALESQQGASKAGAEETNDESTEVVSRMLGAQGSVQDARALRSLLETQ